MTTLDGDQSKVETAAEQSAEGWDLGEEVERLKTTPEERMIPTEGAEIDDLEESRETLTGAPRTRPKYWGVAVALLMIIGAIVVMLVGAWKRGDLLGSLQRVALRSKPHVLLVESQRDKSLLLESDGRRNRVLVQRPDQESWLLVSRDDFTAANPALSPDGSWVAYLSKQDAPEIVVVPLELPGHLTYTSTDLESYGRRSDIAVTSVCSWTPIAWAADSARLAFFGCADDPALSRAFVATLSGSRMTLKPSLVTGTVASGLESRQILWLGADQVSVTFPPTGISETETVRTFSTR